MVDYSFGDLRVLRAVAARGPVYGGRGRAWVHAVGDFQASGTALERTRSSLSGWNGREGRPGVRLTPPARCCSATQPARPLRRCRTPSMELDGEADAVRARPVRLGAFASAAAGVVPSALGCLARDRPDIVVALREGTSAVLTRALRAGNLDIALLAGMPPHMPPDARDPTLDIEILAEGPLRIAVGASHRLAKKTRPGRALHAAELTGERWVVAHSEGEERLLGVWPGSPAARTRPTSCVIG